jgi:hypothetical protein
VREISYCSVYFDLLILVPNGSGLRETPSAAGIIMKPRIPVRNLAPSTTQSTSSIFQLTTETPLPLQFRNPRLEKIINAKQNRSQLSLSSMELIDQDMEIVASYMSRSDTVRKRNNSE